MVTNLCLVMVWISLVSTEDGTKKTYVYHKHKSVTIYYNAGGESASGGFLREEQHEYYAKHIAQK